MPPFPHVLNGPCLVEFRPAFRTRTSATWMFVKLAAAAPLNGHLGSPPSPLPAHAIHAFVLLSDPSQRAPLAMNFLPLV